MYINLDNLMFLFYFFQILDLNDNSPTFPDQQKQLTIPETVPVGVSFMLPHPSDLDSVEYGIQHYHLKHIQGPFELIVNNKSRGGGGTSTRAHGPPGP